jgi:hypothetical protein
MNPAIIALILGSFLVTAFALYGSALGWRILKRWDLQNGSEEQLSLEKKTYLLSTILGYLFAFQIFSLLLFVYTADHMHGLFVGAMCAAGSLNVNDYGYPTLVVKMINVFFCGLWIVINQTDHQGYDYPLIKAKYRFLMVISVSLLIETVLQSSYFSDLKADVITSCCGRLFSEHSGSFAGELAALPTKAVKIVFFLTMLLLVRTGIHFLVTGRAAGIFSTLSAAAAILSLFSVISFIALYFYELPTHHCPFCLLQREYDYIGYPLYLALYVGGIMGVSVGVLDRLKGKESLKALIPALQKRHCLVSMTGYLLFVSIAIYPMIFSSFVLRDG